MDRAEVENGIIYEKTPGRIVQGEYHSKKYPRKLRRNNEKFHSETNFTEDDRLRPWEDRSAVWAK